jgi:hypothetical protein
MALAAAQVIDAVAAKLAPMAATGGRVYTSRAWPITTLPAWRVTAQDEQIDIAGVAEPINQHTLDINATAFASAADDLDDAMHALAASGLALLFAPTVPYGMQLTGIGRQLTTEGEANVGAITLRLRCLFFVDPSTPETVYS